MPRNGSIRRRLSACGQPGRSATIFACSPMRPVGKSSPPSSLCANNCRSATDGRTLRLPSSLRRWIAGKRIMLAVSSSPPESRRLPSPNASSARMTITPLSWSRRSPTGLPRAFAELMHQRVRKEFWGYAPEENLACDDLIGEALSRHPPGAGLSGPARSHGKGNAVPSARCGSEDRCAIDRELCHVAGLFGIGHLYRPSGQLLFRRAPRSSATRWKNYAARKSTPGC